MHRIQLNKPHIDTEGLLFHIDTISNGLPDGPRGIWINNELVQNNPILRKVMHNGISIIFFALNPLWSAAENAPIRALHNFTLQSPDNSEEKGTNASVEVYAVLEKNIDEKKKFLEIGIKTGNEYNEITELTHDILSFGYDCTRIFIDNLRSYFQQYWLTISHHNSLKRISYYSSDNKEWYSISPDKNYVPNYWEKDHKHSCYTENPYILFSQIDSGNISDVETPQDIIPQTFADEMISTALIELSKGRVRSSILHAIIALESSAQQALAYLLENRFKGLGEGKIIDAISKEVSLKTLSHLVYGYATDDKNSNKINWDNIKDICDTRNMIVHKGQRKLPKYIIIKNQLIEIFKFVQKIDSVLSK